MADICDIGYKHSGNGNVRDVILEQVYELEKSCKTKISFHKFYLCLSLLTMTKKGFSVKEKQQQLFHKRYRTILVLMYRLNDAIGQREDLYKLSGAIEMDEEDFNHTIKENQKLNQGRGRQRKNIAVIADSTPITNLKTRSQSYHLRFAKMKVFNNNKANCTNEAVKYGVKKAALLLLIKARVTKFFRKYFNVILVINQLKFDKNFFKMSINYYFKRQKKSFRNLSQDAQKLPARIYL